MQINLQGPIIQRNDYVLFEIVCQPDGRKKAINICKMENEYQVYDRFQVWELQAYVITNINQFCQLEYISGVNTNNNDNNNTDNNIVYNIDNICLKIDLDNSNKYLVKLNCDYEDDDGDIFNTSKKSSTNNANNNFLTKNKQSETVWQQLLKARDNMDIGIDNNRVVVYRFCSKFNPRTDW